MGSDYDMVTGHTNTRHGVSSSIHPLIVRGCFLPVSARVPLSGSDYADLSTPRRFINEMDFLPRGVHSCPLAGCPEETGGNRGSNRHQTMPPCTQVFLESTFGGNACYGVH